MEKIETYSIEYSAYLEQQVGWLHMHLSSGKHPYNTIHIALDNMFFCFFFHKNELLFSYFCMKTYTVGIHY